ncbi:oxygenase MpaB family protein [Nocardioides sp.]|uniref:oxygenase MpaB family protein n=1 Tax=Nocardioides sp. TaxID=35761 RepID=UPI002C49347B|nr:oxygenase MpaB family protein [Nocardioides sp.]HVX56011.1 oxygenase MpaB family protein [Nocardioides sp.]
MSTTTTRPAHPARFRQAEARGRRIGRPLLVASGIDRELDEALMQRIGAALLERDELGARLAEAMRLPPSDPDRVSHAQLAAALASPHRTAALPPTLTAFLDEVRQVPDWVDWDRVERGAATYRYLGRSAHDVLLQLSLIGGYRFGGPADLLVLTGGLGGANTLRRLAETQAWTLAVSQPGGMRPGAEGWRLTVHVRAMHALVNSRFERRWDRDRFGLPINQADQAGTLGLFDATVIIGCRALGVPLSRQQRDDLMHLWRYLGWLLGVHADFLTDDERERTRINYHVLVAAGAQTQAGRDLARASVDAQVERSFGHASPVLERLHQRYARARVLSMLTAFVGVRGMRDLGLPARVPWAFALAFAGNTVRYRLLGALPGGRRRLEERGARVQQELLASTFRGSPAQVGALPDAR